jgi:dipeptidyl aminopeptidase/acylaminoacyl peptidase
VKLVRSSPTTGNRLIGDSGGSSWQIPDFYSTHSPLTYVTDITAPLLILHGEADFRCSVTEADQLFGALRKLKRTVELVRYHGSSHAFAHTGPAEPPV